MKKYNNVLLVVLTWLCLLFPLSSAAQSIPDWARMARTGGFDAGVGMPDQEITGLINTRVTENVSVLEVDSGLSEYLNETQFQNQINFLNKVAAFAKQQKLRTVIYYPALEVLTKNGETLPNTGVA